VGSNDTVLASALGPEFNPCNHLKKKEKDAIAVVHGKNP
jgi:hypothetical protein